VIFLSGGLFDQVELRGRSRTWIFGAMPSKFGRAGAMREGKLDYTSSFAPSLEKQFSTVDRIKAKIEEVGGVCDFRLE